jgi:hypothetical protein
MVKEDCVELVTFQLTLAKRLSSKDFILAQSGVSMHLLAARRQRKTQDTNPASERFAVSRIHTMGIPAPEISRSQQP